MSNEQANDPLSQTQKHVMMRNGTFEFDTPKRGTCCCGHSINDHLEMVDCCIAKSEELCICDRFLDKESKIITTISRKQGKLPQKEDVLPLQDQKVDNYIQQLAKI